MAKRSTPRCSSSFDLLTTTHLPPGAEVLSVVLTALVATVSRRRLSRSRRLALDATAASTAASSAASTITTKDQP